MKVAIHVDGPVIRGNERQVIRIAAGLRARGHDVAVSCRAGGPVMAALDALGIRTTGIRPGGDADPWNALRFAAWLRRERPDAVLLTSWNRAFVSAWSANAARMPRIVFRIGGIQPIGHGARGWLERLALRRWYHAVIANSRAVAESITRAVPEVAEQVHVVVNGMELDPPRPAPIRRALGLGDDAILLAAVGGLERRKGFDLLVDALPALDARVHAVLVGDGTDAQRRAMEERAHGRGVAERVHLLGRREDAACITAASDAFVLPSRSEGFAVAMLEAMAAGRPVVSADVAGAWEGLAARDGRPAAGWIVPPEDVDALAAALREVVDGIRSGAPEVRARAAEGAWRAANWFTIDRMIDDYEAVLAGRAPGERP
ncbi:MAG TPA: glycosyltransferase [Longimicrobium sp.]|nr:glycosyltransferase [Longimicrobium sp.]